MSERDAVLARVAEQVDYYLSAENLARDFFLVGLMDMHFFVPMVFIATFRRVRAITTDVATIVDALRRSKVCELDSSFSCVRPRNWQTLVKFPTERGFLIHNTAVAGPTSPPLDARTVGSAPSIRFSGPASPFVPISPAFFPPVSRSAANAALVLMLMCCRQCTCPASLHQRQCCRSPHQLSWRRRAPSTTFLRRRTRRRRATAAGARRPTPRRRRSPTFCGGRASKRLASSMTSVSLCICGICGWLTASCRCASTRCWFSPAAVPGLICNLERRCATCRPMHGQPRKFRRFVLPTQPEST